MDGAQRQEFHFQHVWSPQGDLDGGSSQLIPISHGHWLRIIAGRAPLPAHPTWHTYRRDSHDTHHTHHTQDGRETRRGRAQVLTIAGYEARITEVEPLCVTTDAAGFVCRLDAGLSPLPAGVIDLRPRLQRRFLARRLSWRPSEALLRAACQYAGFEADGGLFG
ncbi:MAG: hypothetical protein AAF515_19490 [Pseudomonadota bacterium]